MITIPSGIIEVDQQPVEKAPLRHQGLHLGR